MKEIVGKDSNMKHQVSPAHLEQKGMLDFWLARKDTVPVEKKIEFIVKMKSLEMMKTF